VTDLKTGNLVQLWQLRDSFSIKAKRVPELFDRAKTRTEVDAIMVGVIPAGTYCLYIASQQLAPPKIKFNLGAITAHLVLWKGRPIWVSSSDCELRVINDRHA